MKKNHASKQSVWLVCFKKNANVPTVNWSEAVDEALCFGWIDSTRVSLDNEKFMQFFSRRKPKSVWSKINKEKVQRLTEEKRMTRAGYTSVEIAKQNGSWTILDQVHDLKIPADLIKAFKTQRGSKDYFSGLSKSVRKSMLQWIALAKRPETRKKRIAEIAEFASQKQKPKQFR